MPHVPSHVFRAYDIRGKVQTEITEEFCRLVGKAFGADLRERYKKKHSEVIVGRDARMHSPLLEKALIEGLASAGCAVKSIGQTPSPVNYFALCTSNADGSVQITASHNAKEDNGLKLQVKNAEAFAGGDLQRLRKRIEGGRFCEGKGSIEAMDAVTPYAKKMTSLIASSSSLTAHRSQLNALRIVADFGNGVSGPVYGKILKDLGVELIELFGEPDGTFPNHIADPIKHETLADLISTVQKEKADCGIAFDGDGDRVGFVDENGKIVSADYLLLLLAEDHLKRHPGAPIIYTVSMSSILETEVKKFGGTPVMCTVGHSFVEHEMRKHNSHLAGEQSGHFFCGEDFFDHDDALVATLRILSIFTKSDKPTFAPSPLCSEGATVGKPDKPNQPPFSSLFSLYPKVFLSPEWRPHCSDEKKTDVIRRVTEHFQNEDYPCITIDGVRVDFGDGAWAGIRQSNTSPKLSVCMEARTKEKLKEVEAIVKTHLAMYAEISNA